MKISRIGVFETNSSSAHAITLATGTIKNSLDYYLNQGGISLKNDCLVIDFNEGGPEFEFGWGSDDVCDFISKLGYLLYTIYINANDDGLSNTYKYATYEECEKYISKIITDFLGVDKVEFANLRNSEQTSYFGRASIDHQSTDVALGLIQKNVDDSVLVDYLFNPESRLIISNDNGGMEDFDESIKFFKVSYSPINNSDDKDDIDIILSIKDTEFKIGYKGNIDSLNIDTILKTIKNLPRTKIIEYGVINGITMNVIVGNDPIFSSKSDKSVYNFIPIGELIGRELVFINKETFRNMSYSMADNIQDLIRDNKILKSIDYVLIPIKIKSAKYGEL